MVDQIKTIASVSSKDCTGCGACYNKCPVNAIVMEYDDEGFLFPRVTEDCVHCGLCESVCPALHPLEHHPTPAAYAVWAEDEIRLKSSSGGMFTLLANYVLDQGGVVCGAAYTNDFRSVKHQWAENTDALAPLRGSKYVQSDTGLTYREAEQYLKRGFAVLYTGCPCQIAGLYRYLGREYERLYTADLVCHGANSVTAYQSFIDEFSEGKEIAKVDFRDKTFYQWATPTVVYFKDGSVKKRSYHESDWYKGFLGGIINRKNCSECPYACAERVADITLADCWHVSKIDPRLDDCKGTSLVLVNSEKGKALFDMVSPYMKLSREIPLEVIRKYNGQLNSPAPQHPSRKYFFAHLPTDGYHKSLWYGRGMRFDVGLVGWWFASNYGSSLTYYALGTVLEKMGKQILMIPVAKKDGTPWDIECRRSIDFLSKYFRIGRERGFDKMSEFNGFCDSFMLGSDQMWNGSTVNLVGYSFFLDFVDRNKKKIAFSTSFGRDDFVATEEICDVAKDYLNRFDAISVREQSGVDVCKHRFGIDATHIMDPVFLCSADDYDRVAQDIHDPIPERYLLCYILDPTPEKEQLAQSIARHENLEIITVLGLKEHGYAKNRWHTGTLLPKIDVAQFVYHIKHCSYLLTDSHHGTCFGIIYQKPYVAIANESRGIARFETVGRILGLENRIFLNAADAVNASSIYDPIPYNAVMERIQTENKRATEWLVDALACPVKHNAETPNTSRVAFERQTTVLYRQIAELTNKIHCIEAEYAKSRQACNDSVPQEAEAHSRPEHKKSYWQRFKQCCQYHGVWYTIRYFFVKLKQRF